MIISIFLVILICAFCSLFLGLWNGTHGLRDETEGRGVGKTERDKKHTIGLTFSLLLIAATLFAMTALWSMDLERQHCENQVTDSVMCVNGQACEETTYTNIISCETTHHKLQGMAEILSIFAFFSVIMMFIFVLKGI